MNRLRLLVKLGRHGVLHTRSRVTRQLRADYRASLIAYMFDQGENGASYNQAWRMK